MSTTAKRSTQPPPPSPKASSREAIGSGQPKSAWVLRGFDAVYRFLASLKLAVFSLSTLAGVLAYATFFEKWYGTSAVQEWIYQSPLFAVLLTFLGLNILCAALIRFPWTKRQTGFVITHAGLLVVLVGSWVSFKVTLDGQLGMVEGDESSQIVRIDHPAIRVQPIDLETGTPKTEYQIPFYPGSFAWESSRLAAEPPPLVSKPVGFALATAFAVALVGFVILWVTGKLGVVRPWLGGTITTGLATLAVIPALLAFSAQGLREEILTTPNEPFTLKVKDFIPASSLVYYSPEPGENGVPMLKAGAYITPPNSDQAIDIFARADTSGRDEVRWLKASHPRFRRAARDFGTLLFAFQYADKPGMVEDFLALPENPLTETQTRIHYKDQAGQDRVYIWPVDKPRGESATLPDSDITLTLSGQASVPISAMLDPDGRMTEALGDPVLHYVEFQVQKGDAPAEKYLAASGLPSLPNNPSATSPVVRVHYFHPYEFGEAMQGRSSVIEVLGTSEGQLYYRALSREGLRGKGPLEVGKRIELVRQSAVQPVTFAFEAEAYYSSGVDREMVDPIELPVGQKDKGIPAALVAMTVNDQTKEFWLRQSNDLSPRFQAVTFPDGEIYRVSYDFDRKDLDFKLQLVNFDVGMDPGTSQASSYESEVLLTDPGEGVQNRAVLISMNEPLAWKNYTFYQSNYIPLEDPRTGRGTGQFMSIFQVRYDPVWGITYLGCLLVVLGVFVQFYMRAGVFTNSGKRPHDPVNGGSSGAKSLATVDEL